MIIWDKLLSTPSAEDAAMTGVGMIRLRVRFSTNLPVNHLWFIVVIPWPVLDQLRQPYEWPQMRYELPNTLQDLPTVEISNNIGWSV